VLRFPERVESPDGTAEFRIYLGATEIYWLLPQKQYLNPYANEWSSRICTWITKYQT
jgi:hypothetical protein